MTQRRGLVSWRSLRLDFSTDGDVTAELVFVNYGIPADYEELEKRGIDVKGKIVIAKYYGSWRGIKPKLAAEKGYRYGVYVFVSVLFPCVQVRVHICA